MFQSSKDLNFVCELFRYFLLADLLAGYLDEGVSVECEMDD
jgi:hypothetical protein